MKQSLFTNRKTSPSHFRVDLQSPLGEGILIRSKCLSGGPGPTQHFRNIEGYPLESNHLIISKTPFILFSGWLESFPSGIIYQENYIEDIPLICEKTISKGLLEELFKITLGVKGKGMLKDLDFIFQICEESNAGLFCLTFPRSCAIDNDPRISGIFVFGETRRSGWYGFLNMDGSNSDVLNDYDGNPYFEFEGAAFVKIESDKPLISVLDLGHIFNGLNFPMTVGGLSRLVRITNWQDLIEDFETKKEIIRLADLHGLQHYSVVPTFCAADSNSMISKVY